MSYTSGPFEIRRLGPAEHYAIETTDGEMVAATAVTANALDDARLFAAAPELLEALKVAVKLLGLVTVRQVIEAGNDAIEAVGLNPWCMNEGRATGDEQIPLDFIYRAISKAEGNQLSS